MGRVRAMREGTLTRSAEDRRRFELEGYGWLRSEGWLTHKAGAGATSGAGWRFEPQGWTGGRAEALDATSGLPVGVYRRTGSFRQRGTVTWGARSYELTGVGWAGERFQLSSDGATLVELKVRGWGKKRVALTIDESLDREPGLVLFTCWLVQLLVEQSSAAATSAAT